MLKELQKALGITPKANETLEVKLSDEDKQAIQASIDAAVTVVRAEFDEYKQTAEQLNAENEAVIAALREEGAGLASKLAEMQTALEAANAEKAQLIAAAAAKQAAERKEKMVAVVGTERADALLKVTEGMEDTAFEAVLAALGVSAAAEAASPMFNEAGVDAQADKNKVVETAEMRLLREKYGKK